MQNFKNAILVVSATMMGSGAQAQVQPTSEQQLSTGFLGDQNARLTSQEAPQNDSYASRATAALDRKDYARALAILRPYRRSHELAYHYLAGRAYEGLGDYVAARRELTEAVKRGRTFVGAQLALGLIEAQHGDRAVADAILTSLTERRDKCAAKCSAASELSNAVISLDAVLRTPRN